MEAITMTSRLLIMCLYIICSLYITLLRVNCRNLEENFDKKFSECKWTVVDQSGNGDFDNIQSAIDYIPSNNEHWMCIYIRAGIYREKVTIPVDKPFIMLQGDGITRTEIVWEDHDSIAESATFSSMADNIIVKSISFRNSYSHQMEGSGNNPLAPAVAAMIMGDKSYFYRCGFFGMQDTLWDERGRHYFQSCTIEGAVDFIFGSGQSLYEQCTISVIAGSLGAGVAGYITAQGRSNPEDTNGFVFKECNVIGSGTTYLGRAWRGYSRVLFYKTFLSNIIVPQGWDAWNYFGQERYLTYSEYDCHGLGSNISERVNWEQKLSEQMLTWLTSLAYINADGWLNQEPFHA